MNDECIKEETRERTPLVTFYFNIREKGEKGRTRRKRAKIRFQIDCTKENKDVLLEERSIDLQGQLWVRLFQLSKRRCLQ